jgi:hypothetical protein
MKLVIIQYNLTEIILHSVTDHNCDLRSTVTEANNKTFHWLNAFHPNLTWPVVLYKFKCISLVPNFLRTIICFVFNFNF